LPTGGQFGYLLALERLDDVHDDHPLPMGASANPAFRRAVVSWQARYTIVRTLSIARGEAPYSAISDPLVQCPPLMPSRIFRHWWNQGQGCHR